MITDVLLDRLILVVAANHRATQMVVGDLGLKAVPRALVDASAIDDGEFVGSANVAIEITSAADVSVLSALRTSACPLMSDEPEGPISISQTNTVDPSEAYEFVPVA